MRSFTLPVLTLALLLASQALRADSFRAPPVHKGPAVSIQAYGEQNHECLSWTNGCILCAKDAAGDSHCSLPGIACEPHGLTCKVLRPK